MAHSREVIPGFVQAGTENEKMSVTSFRAMIDWGLAIEGGVFLVIDGSKRLRAAAREAFGKLALVQRCERHKRENVIRYLPKSEQAPWPRRLQQRVCDRTT